MNSGGAESLFQKLERIARKYPKSKCYLVQILAQKSINVASLFETLDALSSTYNINLTPDETSSGMVAR